MTEQYETAAADLRADLEEQQARVAELSEALAGRTKRLSEVEDSLVATERALYEVRVCVRVVVGLPLAGSYRRRFYEGGDEHAWVCTVSIPEEGAGKVLAATSKGPKREQTGLRRWMTCVVLWPLILLRLSRPVHNLASPHPCPASRSCSFIGARHAQV